jgi:hypothetical protein
MELKCGATVHQQSMAPYIVGCLLPHTVIRPGRLLPTKLEAQISFATGQAVLELHVQAAPDFHTNLVLSPSEHRDFLRALSQAGTLYLLTGHDHPGRNLAQRVRDGGVAIESNEDIRTLCLLLTAGNQFDKKAPVA